MTRHHRHLTLLLACSATLLGRAVAGEAGAATQTPPLDARKIFEQSCFDCHGDGEKKGKFSLEELLQAKDTDAGRAQWQKTWKTVRQGFMPPADADEPLPERDRKVLTQWIEQQRLGVDYAQPDPGRVTIRRLNRIEYEYTITDLFGVDLVADGEFSSDGANSKTRLREMLPPDDTAFGFDNNGDFQTLSPALLEKYFNLAEYVVDHVISQDGPRFPVQPLNAADVKVSRANDRQHTDHELGFDVSREGKYRLEVQFALGGWQEYGGAYDFALRVDDHPTIQEMVENGGQKTYRLAGEMTLARGPHRLAFTTDATKPAVTGKFEPLELRPKMRLVGPLDPSFLEYPESHRAIFFKGAAPGEEAARRTYAREILQRVADRAFRRPTPPALLDRLADLAMRSPQFERGVGEGIMAILTSPKFLYRAELQAQPDDPKAIHPIDEYALASRLSYLLWLSLPDEELHGLAERGELRKYLPGQLRRMLADPKAARFFEDFPGQWLRTRNVLMTPIARSDQVVDGVRGAMKRETEMLYEYIARNDRDLLELVTADYTFVDRGLANFYGLPPVAGDGFQKVTLPAESHRGGLLTQGCFLFSTSNPGRTSPVKRGLYLLETLLAIQPPPPPPSIPALDDAKVNGEAPKTIREQLAIHRADKSCAACHAHFDPIGLALENYDAVARWRTTERGEPIVPSEKTVTGQTLTGVADLKQMFVARKHQFYACLTEKLLTYALGRGLEPADAITVERIADEVERSGGKFSTLLAAVVQSPPFQTRRGDDGSLKIAPRVAVPETPPPDQRKGRKFRRPLVADQPGKDAAATVGPAEPATKPEEKKISP